MDWARELAALGPKRLTVLVDVSNQCNIRCRMCYFSFDSVFHRTAVHMRPDAYRTLAAELLPNARILYLSAGNEPLVSPHFEEILRITSEYELDDVKFLTNGLLLGPAIAETILATNVTQVHLSIDGATRETYEWVRRGGCFDTFVENVRHLARRKVELGRERPCLQFNITLMRANLEELPLFVDLAEELGVTRIACRHLMPYSGLDIEDQVLSNDKAAANRGLERMLERVMRSDTVELVNFPDLFSAAEPAAAPTTVPAAAPAATPSAALAPCEPAVAPGPPAVAPQQPAASDLLHDAEPPFGAVDEPQDDVLFGAEAIEFRGWALATDGVQRVVLRRAPLAGDEPTALDETGLVPLGDARFLPGWRPDVGQTYPGHAFSWRTGWAYELRRDALPEGEALTARVHVFARDRHGCETELGRRTIAWTSAASHAPYLYCHKPFDNVYADSAGNIYPYPDCQTVDPFGALGEGAPFEAIWNGAKFNELRRRIIARDPPRMCLTCPDFINRSVDEASYFNARDISGDFTRAFGHLDRPDDPCEVEASVAAVELEGWALGFEGLEAVEVLREALPEDPLEPGRTDGLVALGEARFHAGRRPDVARRYRRYAGADRAAFTFRVTRAHLSTRGRGVVRVLVRTRDSSGTITHIAGRTLVFR